MQCLVLAFYAVLYLLYLIMSFIHFLCFISHVSPEVVLQRSLTCKDPEKHGATFCWSALDELKILCLIRMSWLWLECSIEAMILTPSKS